MKTNWRGKWQNQYGSILTITDDTDNHLQGSFQTALGDSGFAGVEVDISGIHIGECIHFAFSRTGQTGDTIASFTGLLRNGKLETVWHVISDSAFKSPQPGLPPELMRLPWPHAVMTNSDTFERIN